MYLKVCLLFFLCLSIDATMANKDYTSFAVIEKFKIEDQHSNDKYQSFYSSSKVVAQEENEMIKKQLLYQIQIDTFIEPITTKKINKENEMESFDYNSYWEIQKFNQEMKSSNARTHKFLQVQNDRLSELAALASRPIPLYFERKTLMNK